MTHGGARGMTENATFARLCHALCRSPVSLRQKGVRTRDLPVQVAGLLPVPAARLPARPPGCAPELKRRASGGPNRVAKPPGAEHTACAYLSLRGSDLVKLTKSAHVDTFCRDHLPPGDQWPDLRFELPELAYPDRLNCAATLVDEVVAAHGPDRPCLITPDGTWTYGDLLTRSNQVARVLTEDYGLVPGQRVMLRAPNNPWLVACWFGALKAGCVVLTTMPLLRLAELGPLAELTRPALLICDHRFVGDLPEAAPGAPLLTYGCGGEDDLITRCAAKPGSFTNVDTAADDVALLAMTSGTTGRPKVAMHFHRDVLTVADTFGKHLLKATPSDVFAGTPPLGFAYGICGLLALPMRLGAAVLLLERAAPPELAEAVAQFAATVLFTTPTAYRMILRSGKIDRLTGLRRAVSAGEHLPAAVWAEIRDK